MTNDEHIAKLTDLLDKIVSDLVGLGYVDWASWIESQAEEINDDDR